MDPLLSIASMAFPRRRTVLIDVAKLASPVTLRALYLSLAGARDPLDDLGRVIGKVIVITCGKFEASWKELVLSF